MACRGVHFALTEPEVQRLRSLPTDNARLTHVTDVIDAEYFANQPDKLAESDKAWDAIHRALTDGKLKWSNGQYPLNHVVLGGESLCGGDDYIMSLKSPQEVRDISLALGAVNEQEFRVRYFAINPNSYGCALSEEDFGYSWEWLQNVRRLYELAAKEDRYVLFTVDQ